MKNILNQIKVTTEVSETQDNLFTPYHRKYKVVIKYNGKQYTTTYQCNAKHQPNPKDIIYCLLLDASSYDNANNIEDFANEFGYELYDDYGYGYNKETEKVYKACKKTSDAMHRMFTEEEMESIYEVLDEELN
jgi:hypothetical protein